MVDLIPMPDHDAEEIKRRLEERDAADKRATASFNERAKLTAGMISQLGLACVIIGVITPLFAVGVTRLAEFGVGTTICIIAWIALHLLARRILKGLK